MESLSSFLYALPKLLSVLPATCLLFVAIVLAGILLGLGLAAIRLKKNRFLNAIAAVLISFERGTPLLIQILIVYFGLRAILVTGLRMTAVSRWSPAYFAFIAYGVNLSCFLCETFRAAYLSIERGQIEAAESIGMTKFQTFIRVILPQGAKVAMPNMGNLLLDDFKAISLAFSIGLVEIMGRGQALASAARGVGAVGIYAAVALVFWIICFLLDKLFIGVERRLSRYARKPGQTASKAPKASAVR